MAYQIYPITFIGPIALIGSFALGIAICCCWTHYKTKLRFPEQTANRGDDDEVVIPRIASDAAYQKEQREQLKRARKLHRKSLRSKKYRGEPYQSISSEPPGSGYPHQNQYRTNARYPVTLYDDHDQSSLYRQRQPAYPQVRPGNVQQPSYNAPGNGVALSAVHLPYHDNPAYQRENVPMRPYHSNSQPNSYVAPPSYSNQHASNTQQSPPPYYNDGRVILGDRSIVETNI